MNSAPQTNERARHLYDRVAGHQGFIRYDDPVTWV